MSSLAAARADNFYYPPQYDPSKGSLNKVSFILHIRTCAFCFRTSEKLVDSICKVGRRQANLSASPHRQSSQRMCANAQFNGQHPLRDRAKKLGEGILIIRFEMPFNVWCGKCNHLIGKGVRFNAEKKVGHCTIGRADCCARLTSCDVFDIDAQVTINVLVLS